MSGSHTWIVTTDGKRPLREIAKDLAAQGFAQSQLLDEIAVITGTAEDDAVARLRKVAGVADISSDWSVDIGPPDAVDTW